MKPGKQGQGWCAAALLAGVLAGCTSRSGAEGGALFAEHMRRAQALFQQGNYPRAHLAYQRARNLVPGNEEAALGVDLSAVAVAAEAPELITDGNINEIDYTLDVLEGRPGVPPHLVYTARGNLLARAGKPTEAVAAYRKALDQKGDYAPALMLVAQVLAQSGKGGEAEAVLRALVKGDPKHVPGRQLLATLLVNRNAADEATQVLQEGLALGGSPVLHATLGVVAAKAGRANDAESAFREALKLDPDMAPALYGLGALLFRTERNADAVELLRHYLAVARARGEPEPRIQEVQGALEQAQRAPTQNNPAAPAPARTPPRGGK